MKLGHVGGCFFFFPTSSSSLNWNCVFWDS
jgi:hypothetical protein